MNFHQLDMFTLFTAEMPAVKPAAKPLNTVQVIPQVTPQKNYSIEPATSPLKGFRVVTAPGLTTAHQRKNPCSVCSQGHKDKSRCSEDCRLYAARQAYLDELGVGLVSGVDSTEGHYGVVH